MAPALLYPDHIWGNVSERVRKGITSTALLPPLPPALRAQPRERSWGEGVEEEGSWSPGSPPAAPYGRREAWITPAASGQPPRGALGAPRRRALRVPRPGPSLTALHLAAFLGGRRVPHDWGDGKMGSGREMGAGAAPAAPQAEVTPASAAVGAVSVPGTSAQSPGGKTGPVLSAGLQLTPLPGSGSGGERTLPLPEPRPPCAPPAAARPGQGPVALLRRARAPEVTYGPGLGRPTDACGARAGGPGWPGRAGARPAEPDVVARVGVQIPIPEQLEAA